MKVISTAEFQTQLAALIPDVIGDVLKNGRDFEWKDAERFLDLAMHTVDFHVELSHSGEELRVATYLQVDGDQDMGGGHAGIAEMAIASARWYEEDGNVDDGSQLVELTYTRDKLRVSLGRIEARIAELSGA